MSSYASQGRFAGLPSLEMQAQHVVRGLHMVPRRWSMPYSRPDSSHTPDIPNIAPEDQSLEASFPPECACSFTFGRLYNHFAPLLHLAPPRSSSRPTRRRVAATACGAVAAAWRAPARIAPSRAGCTTPQGSMCLRSMPAG